MDLIIVAKPGQYSHQDCTVQYIFAPNQYMSFLDRKLTKLIIQHDKCTKYEYKNCCCRKKYFIYYKKLGGKLSLYNPDEIVDINGYDKKINIIT